MNAHRPEFDEQPANAGWRQACNSRCDAAAFRRKVLRRLSSVLSNVVLAGTGFHARTHLKSHKSRDAFGDRIDQAGKRPVEARHYQEALLAAMRVSGACAAIELTGWTSS
jgi:hypothetical protein